MAPPVDETRYYRPPARGRVLRRFTELRYEGDRTVSGIAMRYGDTAAMPWGQKERFERGAFGNVERADVILNMQHDRGKPLARSDGGDLALTDSPTELRVSVELPDTPNGNEALALVQKRVLRGFSVEFIPDRWREERAEDLIVIEAATLRGIGLVDKPAYTAAKVDKREGTDMDEAQIQALIDAAFAKRSEGETVDTAALARSITGAVTETINTEVESKVREQVDAALAERDAETERREKAEADAAAAAEKAEADRAQAEADVETRADLIVMVRPLIGADHATRGQTNHDLLVAAVGDEVADAAERSEDYLMAKVETILERREAATRPGPSGVPPNPTGTPNPSGASMAPVNIIRQAEKRAMAALARTAT